MIRVYPDGEAVARAATEYIVARSERAIAARGRFTIALSGGSTPRETYRLLARTPVREAIAWERVHVFWGDERCVDGRDERHNGRMARQELLDHVPVPADQIHPIFCAQDPEATARAYAGTLASILGEGDEARLDLALLGLGPDGHTASLFPGATALDESERWVVAVGAAEAGGVPRVTLTAPFLRRSRATVFLVTGAEKAEALRIVQRGPRAPARWPAQLIHSGDAESVSWFVDREAAAGLEGADDAGASTTSSPRRRRRGG